MHSLSVLLAVFFAAFVFAQTESSSSNYDDYMSQSPACSRACQKAALETDGCSDIEDFDCHCTNIAILESILEPCLAQTLHCVGEELAAVAKSSVCDFSKSSPPSKPELPGFPSIKPEIIPSMPPVKPNFPGIPTPKPELPFIPSTTPGLPVLPSSKPELPLIPSSKPVLPLESSSKPELPATPSSKPIILPTSSPKPIISSTPVISSLPPSSKPAVPSSSPTTLELPTPSPVKPSSSATPPTKPYHSSEVQSGTASSETSCPSIINGQPCPIHGIVHPAPTETPVPVVTKTVVIPSSKPTVEAPAYEEPAPQPEEVDACQPPRTTIVVTATRPPNASGTPGNKGYEQQEEEESAAAPTAAMLSLALPVAALVGLLQVI